MHLLLRTRIHLLLRCGLLLLLLLLLLTSVKSGLRIVLACSS
jgi:hypothetical protein